MEFNSALPIYLQVMASIKKDIVTGRLIPGDKLPSVRDLAIQYTINPNTVSRVYRELELEGVCFTKRGMGTFVTEDEGKVQQMRDEMAEELVNRFLEGMHQLGISSAEALRLLQEHKTKTQQSNDT
ncbi:MAG: GntR family transcriptional regulator [Lachnospiraceae bacterium]|nr:GntR family transcriptional regulator [Lachnospiraceae bacterium]